MNSCVERTRTFPRQSSGCAHAPIPTPLGHLGVVYSSCLRCTGHTAVGAAPEVAREYCCGMLSYVSHFLHHPRALHTLSSRIRNRILAFPHPLDAHKHKLPSLSFGCATVGYFDFLPSITSDTENYPLPHIHQNLSFSYRLGGGFVQRRSIIQPGRQMMEYDNLGRPDFRDFRRQVQHGKGAWPLGRRPFVCLASSLRDSRGL